MSDWVRSDTFAAAMSVKVVTVRRWCKAGTIRARKINRMWFVHRSELEGGYDDERALASRGIPVPGQAEAGGRVDLRPLDGSRVDAGRTPPVSVRKVEGGRGSAAQGAAAPARPVGSGRSAKPATLEASVEGVARRLAPRDDPATSIEWVKHDAGQWEVRVTTRSGRVISGRGPAKLEALADAK